MPPKTGKKAAKATNTAPKTPTPKKNRTPKESPASSSKKRKRNESSAAGETDPEPTNRRVCGIFLLTTSVAALMAM